MKVLDGMPEIVVVVGRLRQFEDDSVVVQFVPTRASSGSLPVPQTETDLRLYWNSTQLSDSQSNSVQGSRETWEDP